MIGRCQPQDFGDVLEIINDGASAYRGVIPADRWHDPYMSHAELRKQIQEGVEFWGYRERKDLTGVMGIQFKDDVTLIRHAYVRTAERKKGIGGKLLRHLCDTAKTPVLIGTWAAASWAIAFYQKHGFSLLSKKETLEVLPKYWSIPARQIETSVVLVDKRWKSTEGHAVA